MEFRKLSSEIAKIEGKKKEVAIGNVREILKITLHLLGKELNEGDVMTETKLLEQLRFYGKKKMK